MQKNGNRIAEEFREYGLPVPEFVRIPEGTSIDELWTLFAKMKELLKSSDFDEIQLDITNGYRTLPFFISSAITFVRMIQPDCAELSVFYGAYDSTKHETDIWDMSLFSDILDWTRRITLFMESGNGTKLSEEFEKVENRLRLEWYRNGQKGDPPGLQKFSSALKAFTADFATLRTGSMLLPKTGTGEKSPVPGSAEVLYNETKDVQRKLKELLPPFAEVMDMILSELEGVGVSTLSDEKGLSALSKLAELYFKKGRYSESIATVREGWINAMVGSHSSCEPGNPCCSKRNRDDQVDHDHKGFLNVREIRNDIQHAGYRHCPAKAGSFILATQRSLRTFSDMTEKAMEIGREAAVLGSSGAESIEKQCRAEEASEATVMVNISNHPSETWGDLQRNKALELASNLVDIQFPLVSPSASDSELVNMANELVENMPQNVTTALVAGDFVLTTLIVQALQRKNICCIAAASERKVSYNSDGNKIIEFNFEKYRPYPLLINKI
jgi:hypothetical protein